MPRIKAIRLTRHGGPEVLEWGDHDLPDPGPGEVRVRHTAIGLNFLEIYQRTGLYPFTLPSGLGGEAAGVVEALGEGVTQFKPGDRVGYCNGVVGAYAEANNAPVGRLVRLPDDISDETAASSLLKGMTAQYLLRRTYRVERGDMILFHAAAGGVGQIACQWAKHLGASVIGTTSSPGKVERAKANGCDHVVLTSDPDWPKKVRALSGGTGLPVVYDSVGKDTFEGSLDCLRVRGLMVSFGNASGPVPAFAPAILASKGSLYLTRPTLAHYVRTAEELQQAADDLFALLLSGAVTVAVGQRFALKDAAKAQEALADRQTIGATVLVP